MRIFPGPNAIRYQTNNTYLFLFLPIVLIAHRRQDHRILRFLLSNDSLVLANG